MKTTNVKKFFESLNAGIFQEKLAAVLSEVAGSTVEWSDGKKTGKVTIELTFKKVGDHNQVITSAKLAKVQLTKRGKKQEDDTTDTPMFVGQGGELLADQPKEDYSGQFGLTSIKE